MDDKHTPGPWALDDSYDPTGSLQGWAYVIAEEEAMYDAANASDDDAVMDAANETHAANARLIAAAPTLLEALRGAERSLSAHLADAARVAGVPIDTLCACNSVELAAVRAAINLATTGEEP